jgi:hypothetical protein
MLEENSTYDMMADTASNVALYHVRLSDDEEFLTAEAALVGFDYQSSSNFLFICQDFRVVVSGVKILDKHPAALYWGEDLLEFPVQSLEYYQDRNDFLAKNPPRYAIRAQTGENIDYGEYR